MRFMTHKECALLGLEPYAVYGGKVYSYFRFGPNTTTFVTHGHEEYKRDLDRLEVSLVVEQNVNEIAIAS